MNFLKFITAGNVDDGKSTLLGRLLMDIGKIPLDIVQSVSNKTSSNGEVNLAYITDGLKKEREEGITIDVSYKYFSIKKRKYIIIDAPGHFEYTRNMFTGLCFSGCHLPSTSLTENILSLDLAFSSSLLAPPIQASNPNSFIVSKSVKV